MGKLNRKELERELIRLGMSNKRSKFFASNININVIYDDESKSRRKTREKDVSEVIKGEEE